ncbi:MAG: proprotein convertase P-domain-containing protein, partial [Chloroflexota bacterium]
ADISVSFSAAPVGIAYSILNDDYFFIQDELNQFENLADWETELNSLCLDNPEHPDCERDPNTQAKTALRGSVQSQMRSNTANQNTTLDFNAQDELNTVQDVTPPQIGNNTEITYNLEVTNRGDGSSTGLTANIFTWGPITLPDGVYDIDESGEYYSLELDLGTLAPGETKTVSFNGLVDLAFDEANNFGWATLDMTVYDDTGDFVEGPIDWLYLDHPLDQVAPYYLEIQDPLNLIAPGENTFVGFVQDYSAVPTITLEITDPNSQISYEDCLDESSDDGTWACTLDLSQASDGQVFKIRGQATDIFGQTSDWSDSYNVFYNFIVDAIPPTIALDSQTSENFADGLIGPLESSLSGVVNDNRQVSAVEICDVISGEETCVKANLTADPATLAQQNFSYTDSPANPISMNAAVCGSGTEIRRTFNVPENFTVADVDFGLNLEHPYRDDIQAYLTSPAGTQIILVDFNSEADNYDVLFNDATTLVIFDDEQNHDPAAPYYENERTSNGYLSDFNGENAAGVWELLLCDSYPDGDTGTYNHSQLFLRADIVPENTQAAWSYSIFLPEEDKSAEYSLTIYGLDSVGNRSTAPINLTYAVDTVAPEITVTTNNSRFNQSGDAPVLAGVVSDQDAVNQMRLTALDPEQRVLTANLTLAGQNWAVYTNTKTFASGGLYQVWVEAFDVAGNQSTIGPFEVMTGARYNLYLPLLRR